MTSSRNSWDAGYTEYTRNNIGIIGVTHNNAGTNTGRAAFIISSRQMELPVQNSDTTATTSNNTIGDNVQVTGSPPKYDELFPNP